MSEQSGVSVVDNGSDDQHRVAENYQYWRDQGASWAFEYAQRKTWLVLYHIQELMITDYMIQHARAAGRNIRVLEFGCGVGRHLKNLSKVPGVEVFGFDQSETMAAGMLEWAGNEWFQERVRVGDPTGPLPFEDGYFDIVYSAEVLVHIRPEDLGGRLSEILRVARGHVLHIETNPAYPVHSDVHFGCWKHDFVAEYAKLGRECEMLPFGYKAHSPYRVTVGQAPVFEWHPRIIDLYRRMENDIDHGFGVADGALRETRATIAVCQGEKQALEASVASTQTALSAADLALADAVSRGDVLVAQLEVQKAFTQAGVEREEALRTQLQATAAELEGERAQASANADIHAQQVQEMSASLETSTRLLDEVRTALNASEVSRAQLESQVAHWQLRLSQNELYLQSQIDSLKRVAKEREENLARANDTLQHAAARERALIHELQSIVRST